MWTNHPAEAAAAPREELTVNVDDHFPNTTYNLLCVHYSQKLLVLAVSFLLNLFQSLAIYGIWDLRFSITKVPSGSPFRLPLVGMVGVPLFCQWPHLTFVDLFISVPTTAHMELFLPAWLSLCMPFGNKVCIQLYSLEC